MKSFLLFAIVSLFTFSESFAQTATATAVVSSEEQAPQKFQMLVQLMREQTTESCQRQCDDRGFCQTYCYEDREDIPTEKLLVRGTLRLESSELSEFREKIDFSLDKYGAISVKSQTDNVVVVTHETQSQDRHIAGRLTRDVNWKVKVISKKDVSQFYQQGIKNLVNDKGVVRFDTKALPSNFDLKILFTHGKKCYIWMGNAFEITNSPGVKVTSSGNTSKTSIDLSGLEDEFSVSIFRRKACIDLKLYPVPRGTESYDLVFGLPYVNENLLL